ncbi:MAG: 1-acyl-sn-glycerol-3-phosphate acyltransferase [Akkermansiaceae bacterium]|nr:1-acyl-sn-glycerol-3-phosphate acyltransferase [Akkermansiaceae bacterium]
MRRLRNDLPYTFRPPKMQMWLRPLILLYNRHQQLRRSNRIAAIESEGFEQVAELHKQGHSIILAPNHSDHSDPHLLIEVCAQHGMHPYFMGAREIFEASALNCWALQVSGVFSVDRDGPDLSAIKAAIGLLEEGKQPLVMFPEGEIYHHHRRVDPLNEGVASILLKAVKRLKEGKQACLVPVGMSFFHDPAVEETFSERLSKLEDRIGWTPKPSMGVVERVVRLATGVLALKETEFLGEACTGEIRDRLTQLCDRLLSDVESRYPKDGKAMTPPERVRALRYRIRRRLLDEKEPPSTEERHALLDDLDRVFTALQAHSYIGDYVSIDPSTDRTAEMIMKLEEDLFGYPNYPVDRKAVVKAGEPIVVSQLITDGSLSGKSSARELTRMLEDRLQSLLG